jgi:cytochrome c oxidase subunit 2
MPQGAPLAKESQDVTRLMRLWSTAAAALSAVGVATVARAQEIEVHAEPWQMGLQPANTEVMRDIHWFNNFTLVITGVIMLFVLALLAIIVVKFNAKSNPVPSRTSHHTLIEVVWTVAPVLILLIIALPSFRLLYKQLVIPEADMTIKATASKWNWGYEYPDIAGANDRVVGFISNMLTEAQITDPATQPRNLAVDRPLIVPVGAIVRVQVSATDVIHSFALPAFGIKVDAVPGRLNETWFEAERTGIYYGQCSELCGQRHAFMPIEIRVVTAEQFSAWSETAAATPGDPTAAYELLAEMVAEDAETPEIASR